VTDAFAFEGTTPATTACLHRLLAEDALGQLIEARGRMGALGSDDRGSQLGWVTQLDRALRNGSLDQVVTEAADLRRARIERVVWSGMGGSVQAVRALAALGLCGERDPVILPLDSTDPAAVERLWRRLGEVADGAGIVAVSLGMTSEEPIGHLQWFRHACGLEGSGADARAVIMTLPGSHLDRAPAAVGLRRVAVQLDGANDTPGRMSAPSTRVFLLPVALAHGPAVRDVVAGIQSGFRLSARLGETARQELTVTDAFCALGAWLAEQHGAGRHLLALDIDPAWAPVAPWIEQVMEESLGKKSRGMVVFSDPEPACFAAVRDHACLLRIGRPTPCQVTGLPEARLELPAFERGPGGVVAAGRLFAGWCLAVAVFGFLEDIRFAGQPAVEAYKRYAAELRDRTGPVPLMDERLTRLRIADQVDRLRSEDRLDYLDLTVNGEPEGDLWNAVRRAGRAFSARLGVPIKIRSGPRDYHSTEQSLVDGPPNLLSIRVIALPTATVATGGYEGRFLMAQAAGSVMAMRDAGRPTLFGVLERDSAASQIADLLGTP